MVEQMTSEQAAYAELRDGVEQARAALWQAAWSGSWADAEPKVRVGRDTLAAELAVIYVPAGEAAEDTIEVLWTGAHEALQLVLRALSTAIQFEAAGQIPTVACRRLISEAITTLDEALDTAKGL